ncbi:MAG: penicillin acylase family protein [Prolixibacteraceae bacterium]|nr:penicillin acylase family protein [Prolixibacteraceae bacterium]
MRKFKLILKIILFVLIIAVIAGYLFLNHVKTKAIPDYNATIDLENMVDEVTVYRDQYAIPHIYAQNETDLYRAVGYVMAQDRLWQMDLIRRITTGRLSEVLDPGLVEADRMFRALDFSGKTEKVLKKTDPKILECFDAYCDGVNQYIEANKKKLPFEFTLLGYKPEPWERVHIGNMIGYMAWDLSMSWNIEVTLYKISKQVDEEKFMELIPDMDYQKTPIFPDFMKNNSELEFQTAFNEIEKAIKSLGFEVFSGSNNWAVSGKKSESGYPMLANDMHLGLMAPGIWYQMHQVVEGGLNVTGVVLPGQPFVVCGHNSDIAWGMTNVMLDDIDFYLETLNPENENQYLLDGEWKELKVVEETISVKGEDEPVVVENKFTHRGPVISDFKNISDRAISMAWVGNGFSNEILTVYRFNRATNWDEFREAASHFTSIAQNIAYADKKGNIGLQVCAGVPIREGNPALIYPGDTSLYDWKGIVPFDELPYSYNPESGMVSSANNRTVGDDYQYYISYWYDLPNRIERIREMLSAKEKLSVDDFKAIQCDQLSVFARKFTPVFVRALEGTDLNEMEKQALKILKNWDFVMGKNEAASLIFEKIYNNLMKGVFHDELGDELYEQLIAQDLVPSYLLDKIRITRTSAWLDDVTTSEKIETLDDNICKAFSLTVSNYSEELSADPASWEWGRLHILELNHPMGSNKMVRKLFGVNRGPYSVGGSYHTVCPYSYPMDKEFIANHGASERHIFTCGNWDESETVIPTGTSGIPASRFYCSQTDMYINNEYHADLFTMKAVKQGAKFKTLLH